MTALEKYSSTFSGNLNETHLASIEQGRYLLERLQTNAPRFRGGLGLPEASLIANRTSSAPVAVGYIPVSEMVNDGFPTDKPILLLVKIEQGPNKEDWDEGMSPLRTQNGVMLNVGLALEQISPNPDIGYLGLFTTIAQAAQSALPQAVQAAPEPDNAPRKKSGKGS